MPQPLILGIVGEKSSGKSVVFHYLGRQRGVLVLRFSDVLNEILRMLNLDERDRAIQGKLAESLRHTFGGGVLVRALLHRAGRSRARLVVLDGIRKLPELRAFRRQRGAKVLYVTAPYELRWQRARRRHQRTDDRVSLKKFIQIEKTYPAEVEIPAVGRRADVRIDNVGSRRELFQRVDAMLKQFGVRL